jgi:type II secretory pathway pseudopilin PulG
MGLAGQYGGGDQRGYAMAALLVGLSVMAVMMSAALPVWSHAMKREREAELIWRGEQYKRAIMLYQRKYANAFPPTIDILVEQRFLRKKYKDPVTNEDFQIIPVGGMGGAMGQAFPGMGGQAGAPGQPGMGGQPGGGGPGSGGFGAPGSSSGIGSPGSSASQPGQSTPGFGSTAAQPGMSFGGAAGFQPGSAGAPNLGIQGVTSKSKDTSVRLYNGMNKYNQWAFVALATATRAGQSAATFGQPGMTGMPPVPGGVGGGPFGGFGPGQSTRPGVPGQPGGFGMPSMPGSPVPGGFGSPAMPGAPGGAPPGGMIFTPGQPGAPPGIPRRPGAD